jgi:hypothetical protein
VEASINAAIDDLPTSLTAPRELQRKIEELKAKAQEQRGKRAFM